MKHHHTATAVFPTLLLAVLLVISAPVLADRSGGDRLIRFNISPNGYPPYLIANENGPSGIMWDVMSLVSQRLGYTLQAERIPRKRVDTMLQQGYIDATPRAREWTRQPEQFLFTDPVVQIEEVFFIPVDSDLVYERPEDLHTKTVVTHLGYIYPQLEPHFKAGTIDRFDVSRDRDMFKFLLHNQRFDVLVADRLVGQWILRTEGLQDAFRISDKGISQYDFRIMLRKDWQDFANQFNRELATIRENGELDAILANYR